MKKPIQILIVDDYAVVREGLRAFITTEPGMVVVGEAADGKTAVQQCQALNPDVVVMDLALANGDGTDAIRSIVKSCPSVYVLVLTNFAEEERVLAALKAGAHGYMLKDATTQDIVQAIHDVYRGKTVLHPSVAYVLLRALQTTSETEQAALDALTSRETEILQLVAQGRTNQEIAVRLEIDERTVRVHVSHVLRKLHLDNRTQAALFALRRGLVALE
ncbi:MAG: response regulator transcription factor [Anaerolineales bacterium]|nr:response regulator transcription factor [Anaerolineales bacterium]